MTLFCVCVCPSVRPPDSGRPKSSETSPPDWARMDFKPRVCYLALVPKPSRRTLDRGFRGLYSVVILLVLHVYEYILHVTVARQARDPASHRSAFHTFITVWIRWCDDFADAQLADFDHVSMHLKMSVHLEHLTCVRIHLACDSRHTRISTFLYFSIL